MNKESPNQICSRCYSEHERKWKKSVWKKACSGGARLECPLPYSGHLISPYPPPWCSARAEIEATKKGRKHPKQAVLKGSE